jgi:hypothetical protein
MGNESGGATASREGCFACAGVRPCTIITGFGGWFVTVEEEAQGKVNGSTTIGMLKPQGRREEGTR